MHAPTDFTSSEETGDRFALGINDLGFGVDLDSAHGVVQHGRHERNVKRGVIHAPFTAVEELGRVLVGMEGENRGSGQ